MRKVLFSTLSTCLVAISVFSLPIANIYAYSYIVPLCPETEVWSALLEPVGGCDFYLYALQALFGGLLFLFLRIINSKYLSPSEHLTLFFLSSVFLTSLSVYIGRYYFTEALWFLMPVIVISLTRISHEKAVKGRKKRLKVVEFQDLTPKTHH
ncbi:hypothetical protein, partial [Halospina sp. K52047b]|uniref:hypothetical protein n=1 Tax=Halospina sp. K52047b TaxID=2614160 RepID=UPI001CE4090D